MVIILNHVDIFSVSSVMSSVRRIWKEPGFDEVKADWAQDALPVLFGLQPEYVIAVATDCGEDANLKVVDVRGCVAFIITAHRMITST